MTFRLEFTRRFSMAHRLTSAASPQCATPHGHNEEVTVELVPRRPTRLDGEENIVAEFATVKQRWHRFIDERLDHALQLSHCDALLVVADAQFPEWRVVVTPGDPSTELMAALLSAKCQAILDDAGFDLRVARVRLAETPTNTVVFEGDPREALPAGDGWWWRADESTR